MLLSLLREIEVFISKSHFNFLQTPTATGLIHNKERIVATLGYNLMSVRKVEVVVMTNQCNMCLGAFLENQVSRLLRFYSVYIATRNCMYHFLSSELCSM